MPAINEAVQLPVLVYNVPGRTSVDISDATLARLSSAEAAPAIPKGSAQFVLGEAVVALPLGDVIDFAKERARLEKDLKKTQDEIARFDAKLSNEQFVAKAPEDVLAEQREKRAEAQALAVRLTDAIGRLQG